ncbi:hypothetical protein [Candidatus Chlorohelix sp.]
MLRQDAPLRVRRVRVLCDALDDAPSFGGANRLTAQPRTEP